MAWYDKILGNSPMLGLLCAHLIALVGISLRPSARLVLIGLILAVVGVWLVLQGAWGVWLLLVHYSVALLYFLRVCDQRGYEIR